MKWALHLSGNRTQPPSEHKNDQIGSHLTWSTITHAVRLVFILGRKQTCYCFGDMVILTGLEKTSSQVPINLICWCGSTVHAWLVCFPMNILQIINGTITPVTMSSCTNLSKAYWVCSITREPLHQLVSTEWADGLMRCVCWSRILYCIQFIVIILY